MTSDRLCGFFLLLLGLAVVFAASGFYVPYQYEPLGPKAMPNLVGAVLILCGAWLLAAPQRPADLTIQDLMAWLGWRQALLVILLVAYGLSYEPLGFVVSSLGVTFGLAWLGGARLIQCSVVSLSLTTLGHLVLVEGLGLQLPAGLLAGWL